MRARYVYRTDQNGNVRAQLLTQKLPMRGTPNEAGIGKTFHQRVFDAYRHVEANGQFQGPYPKNMVKRLHETAIARGE